jgi:subtilase family serine protease
VDVPPVPGHRSLLVETQWTAGPAPAVLSAVLDPDGTLPESNEQNNKNSLSFSGGLLPDLVVTDVSFPTEAPSVGDLVEVAIAVTNRGLGAARASQAAVYVDGSVASDYKVSFDGIAVGASVTKTFTWIAQAGPVSLEVVADAFNALEEANELNNTTTVEYDDTLLADLVFLSFTASPASPATDQEVTFTVTIENDGPGDAPASSLKIYIVDPDGGNPEEPPEPDYTLSLSSIEAGGTDDVEFTWEKEVDRTKFRVVIDAGGTVPEANEENNETVMAC